MELKFSVEKITLVPTMTLCIKTVVNMEDKHPLNLNKFNLFVKSIVFNYEPADMD